jgi:gamma-glutamyltranspeptidase/glutathione hydrolase
MTGPTYRDTIYLTVVDKDRNSCSFINSLYFPFGSALTAPKSGVILQNRGAGFVVRPGHPNDVAPRKRPMHTIIPGLAMTGDKVEYSYGVMGGAYQPVGHTHVLTNMIDYGMDPQEALDCPRVFHVGGRLDCERGIPAATMQALGALGHPVARPEMPWGGGQIIRIDWRNGTLVGGSDPRKDGMALGY